MRTKEKIPESMKQLSPEARAVAIERANALVDKGTSEWQAIAMAVAFASDSDEQAPVGPAIHVLYDQGQQQWTLCPDDGGEPTHRFDRLEDATRRARELAEDANSAVYVHGASGALAARYESFGALADDGAIHVLPNDEGSWALKTEGPDGLFERYDTKAEALSAARQRAAGDESALVVHYKSGEVQDQRVY